ncbi:hypothetical protein BDV93DRAFT_521435 [Ceratobasidium sp. AG-I]|nr:hypothetical protein BDV93DRAFT_529696 [Ceratobasidium sp. AG-I]KAF8605598.1 hypothetical protein BDV93DRAFT_521435 [Ceratobasidium sp. AG-I]
MALLDLLTSSRSWPQLDGDPLSRALAFASLVSGPVSLVGYPACHFLPTLITFSPTRLSTIRLLLPFLVLSC